jgi:hypothetical protein
MESDGGYETDFAPLSNRQMLGPTRFRREDACRVQQAGKQPLFGPASGKENLEALSLVPCREGRLPRNVLFLFLSSR